LTVTDGVGRVDPTPATRVVKVLASGADPLISNTDWSVWFADSEQVPYPSIPVPDNRAVNAIDGDVNTFWHSAWYLHSGALPHDFRVNLGAMYDIDGIRYLPRQDGNVNGRVGDYDVYVSVDGVSWGAPVASGTFANDSTEKQVLFAPRQGQFVRFVARSEANGSNTSTAMAEFGVEGLVAACSEPTVTLVQPQTGTIQTEVDVAASACLDPVTHAGWGVGVSVDGTMYSQLYSAPYEIVVPGISQTDGHTVTVDIIDGAGTPQAGVSTQDQATMIGVGTYFLAIGDSITFGYGDGDTSDDTSQDGRNDSKGYTPILSDLLSTDRGYPVVVANEGISGWTSTEALDTFPNVLHEHRDADYVLMQYGTNDAGGAFPLLSGFDKNVGEAGYIGTYKANMQQLIDLAIAAGKTPFLAKVPYPSGANSLIEEYNTVVDQLITENAIEIAAGTPFVAPDFYSYFEDNYNNAGGSEFFDNLHPNGAGYAAMADLWFTALTPAP
jgi:lysophospholipase L1-like esterase